MVLGGQGAKDTHRTTKTVDTAGKSGIVGGGYLCLPPSEQSCTFYRNQDYSGAVYGGRLEAGVKGD